MAMQMYDAPAAQTPSRANVGLINSASTKKKAKKVKPKSARRRRA